MQSCGAAHGPPYLGTPYRARAEGPTPLDFSVVRFGWGRGEGREVTSLPSLSTTSPPFKKCYFCPVHTPGAKLWDGFSSNFPSAAPLAELEGNFDNASRS